MISRSRYERRSPVLAIIYAVVFVGDHIEHPVRSLADVADALMQLGQQALAPQLLELVVEDDALEAAGAGDFTAAGAADEQVVLPGGNGEFVAGVERHPGRRD